MVDMCILQFCAMGADFQVFSAAIRFVLDADARTLRQEERQKLLHVSTTSTVSPCSVSLVKALRICKLEDPAWTPSLPRTSTLQRCLDSFERVQTQEYHGRD